ncbi:MAG: transcription antitermination factor NusB [Deltaproteobacteria bacterium]|nr:transcription antitermination factor NusB [Deltaproteobacteria bacterium]
MIEPSEAGGGAQAAGGAGTPNGAGTTGGAGTPLKGGRGAPAGDLPREGARRLSRRLALSLLFQLDFGGSSPEERLDLFRENFSPDFDEEGSLGIGSAAFKRSWPFARELFLGAAEKREELDLEISRVLINWRLPRLSAVDRNIIRLALHEMRHLPEIPFKTSVNEAVEIAGIYGDADSGAFVNGVLDKFKPAPAEGGGEALKDPPGGGA